MYLMHPKEDLSIIIVAEIIIIIHGAHTHIIMEHVYIHTLIIHHQVLTKESYCFLGLYYINFIPHTRPVLLIITLANSCDYFRFQY